MFRGGELRGWEVQRFSGSEVQRFSGSEVQRLIDYSTCICIAGLLFIHYKLIA